MLGAGLLYRYVNDYRFSLVIVGGGLRAPANVYMGGYYDMDPCAPLTDLSLLQASDILTSGNPPMSPDSSGELSPFDLSGDIGDICPGSPTDDGLEGNQQDGSAGQKWDNHTEIAEQAKHVSVLPRAERASPAAAMSAHFLSPFLEQEAEIENRIAELRKEGFWTPRRLSKFPEPTRPKVQWDYLCEEMQWLSADFGQERRWKRGVARKVSGGTYLPGAAQCTDKTGPCLMRRLGFGSWCYRKFSDVTKCPPWGAQDTWRGTSTGRSAVYQAPPLPPHHGLSSSPAQVYLLILWCTTFSVGTSAADF